MSALVDINDLAYRNFRALGGTVQARIALGDSTDDSVRAMWRNLDKNTKAKFSDEYVQFFNNNAKLDLSNTITSYREFEDVFAQTASVGCVMVQALIDATVYTYRWPKVVTNTRKPDYSEIRARFLVRSMLMPINYSNDPKSQEYIADIKQYMRSELIERLYSDDLVLTRAENQFMYANYTRPYIHRRTAIPAGMHFLDGSDGS